MAPPLRFCITPRGHRLAYATLGRGPLLAVAPGWVSHISVQFDDSAFEEFCSALARRHTVVLFDKYGTGSSDRSREDFRLEGDVEDLEAVIELFKADRVVLFGASQGGPTAITYAARHPERVSHLLLYGTFARGAALATEDVQRSLVALVRAHWGMGSRTLAELFIPRLLEEPRAVAWFTRLQRECSAPEVAARLLEAIYAIDVTALLPRVSAPALVLHRRRDRVIASRQGRELAAGLPNARFVLLEGDMHLPWMGDAAALLQAIDEFLGGERAAEPAAPRPEPPPGPPRALRYELEPSQAPRYELVHRTLPGDGPRAPKSPSRIALAQLDLAMDWLEDDGRGLFRLRRSRLDDLRRKVEATLEEARAHGVDLLLFPEMAIDLKHAELVHLVTEWAHRREMYIVPGTFHDLQARSNVCRVIGPGGGVLWEQEKHIPASMRVGGARIIEGIRPSPRRRVVVCATPLGRIAIVICRDFLDLDLRVELKNCSPPVDIILNPALTPVTEDFAAAHFEARRSLYAYCFFCNAAAFGNSFIYTPEKGRSRRRLPPGREGLLFKDVDLFGLRAARREWEAQRADQFIQSTR